jgi:NTP pyrophosphatase (non-canonical NTP hydrolase)
MNYSLKDICKIQEEFDKSHAVNNHSFYTDINEDNIAELEHLAVCMIGEFGEFCNILKKVKRGDYKLDTVKSDLNEELADTFIYLLKISNQFNIDLEEEFFKKLEKNKKRFQEI